MSRVTRKIWQIPLHIVITVAFFLPAFTQLSMNLSADGVVIKKRKYAGSLEEKSQEAIIIFRSSEQAQSEAGSAVEDLILSIEVESTAQEFAWVIPFPNVPTVHKESEKLFEEVFNFVENRRQFKAKSKYKKLEGDIDSARSGMANEIKVHSRKTVGDYEVAVVSELERGSLNRWLEDNEYQPLADADDVIEFYRQKGYVFACIKYSSEVLARVGKINSHPLRFRFATGGSDAMYFPMKMTGLQREEFDVTLYVFYPKWINNDLNKFGFVHRGFRLVHRDWDTSQCQPNAGKTYSAPETDPYLKSAARTIPTLKRLFQRLYPGQGFYLTKLTATNLQPQDVRNWSDDLWLFPYYTNRRFVPLDAREGGVASAAWPVASPLPARVSSGSDPESDRISLIRVAVAVVIFAALLTLIPLGVRRLLLKEPDELKHLRENANMN